jgi:hypothetical protein
MKSNSTTKRSNPTTAKNLEERFDAGKDVLDYFDLNKAFVRHGGARIGAGRKPLGKIRKQVLLSEAIVAKVNAIAAKKHLSFSAAVENACAALP